MSSWKITLPCTRDEAEAIDFEGAELLGIDPAPVLLTSETIPDDPLAWQIEAYFESKPGKAEIAALQTLVPSAGKAKPLVEKLPDDPSPVPAGMSASAEISSCGVRKSSMRIASRMIGCCRNSTTISSTRTVSDR